MKNIQKKLMAVCVVGSLMLGALVTGGFLLGAEGVEAAEIVFLVSPTPTVEKLIEMIPRFEEKTGIKVTVEAISYESMMEKETLDLRTQQGNYDVFWVEATYLERYTLLEGLEDLQKLAEKHGKDLSDFPQGLRDAYSFDGKLNVMLFESNPMVMVYRKDLLEAKNLRVPTTWEEYKNVIQALHNPPEVYGTSIMGARHEALFYEYLNFLWGFGGQLFDENLYPAINSPEAVEALEFLKSLVELAPPGTLSYTWTESATAFQQGNVGVEIIFPDWTAALRDPNESRVVDTWAYAPIPGTNPTAIGGYGWAVNAYSKDKDAAFEFAYWATSEEVQREIVKYGATLSRESVMGDAELNEKYPYLQALAKAAPRATPPMKIEPYFELLDSISLYLSEGLSGDTSPQDALDAAQQEWVDIMKKSGYVQ
ncbi:MAG: sugar ABC transporter substrate-binding protein [bacterium]|nr:sugar ABC transporter substrate-binding protein [bacterium]